MQKKLEVMLVYKRLLSVHLEQEAHESRCTGSMINVLPDHK